MPQYDFRCDACQHRFGLRFKTYAAADEAAPHCPACASDDVTRLISQVAIPRSQRDYGGLTSQEMLSVLESGDRRQVDEMVRQVGGQSPDGSAVPSPQSEDSPEPH